MGGANSVQSYVTAINKSVVNSIISSYQAENTTNINKQKVVINCNTAIQNYLAATIKCINQYQNKKVCGTVKNKRLCTPTEIKNLCDGFAGSTCEGSNLKLNQSIAINTDITQTSVQWSNITNTIQNTINSNVEQTTGLFEFNDTVKNNINSLIKTVTNTFLNNISTAYINISNQQVINIGGGAVLSVVTMNSAQHYVLNILQTNSQYNNVVNTLATNIRTQVTQDTRFSSILRVILIVLGILLLGLLLLGIILIILKKLRKV